MEENEIRDLLKKHVFRTYTHSDPNFYQIRNILSNHETWKDRLDDIIAVRVTRSRANKALLLKLRTGRMWITTSWRKCILRKRALLRKRLLLTTEEKTLTAAMRNAVRYQIRLFRKQNFGSSCCVRCGSTTTLEVDHDVVPFKILQKQFLEQCSQPVPTEFGFRRSGRPYFLSKNRRFGDQWKRYHKKNASLQWLCKSCNLKKGARIQIENGKYEPNLSTEAEETLSISPSDEKKESEETQH